MPLLLDRKAHPDHRVMQLQAPRMLIPEQDLLFFLPVQEQLCSLNFGEAEAVVVVEMIWAQILAEAVVEVVMVKFHLLPSPERIRLTREQGELEAAAGLPGIMAAIAI